MINATYVATLALLVSLLSLVVSLIALMRDRHRVTARAVGFGVVDGNNQVIGVPWLEVTVSNHGKRAISIAHIFVQPIGGRGKKGGGGRNWDLNGGGDVRLDVGQSVSLSVNQSDPICCWSNFDELNLLDVQIEDALGKRYTATFPKALRWKRLGRRMFGI